MKRLLLVCACVALPYAAQGADRVLVRSAGTDVPTAYSKLTRQQKALVDRARALLKLPPNDRPRASRRLRNHPVSRAALLVQSNPQAIDIDCVYEEEAVGCWIGDTFCGIVTGDVGCWSAD